MKKIINPWKNMEGYNCFGCSPDNEAGVRMEFYEDGHRKWKKQIHNQHKNPKPHCKPSLLQLRS